MILTPVQVQNLHGPPGQLTQDYRAGEGGVAVFKVLKAIPVEARSS